MARHPGTSNSGKPVPAPGLTRASSQNNVTDVPRDAHILKKAGVERGNLWQMQSRRAHPCQTIASKSEKENKYKGFFASHPLISCWSSTGQPQPDARWSEMPEKSLFQNQHSHPPHPHIHSKEKGRAKKCGPGSREQTSHSQHGSPHIS